MGKHNICEAALLATESESELADRPLWYIENSDMSG